MNEPIPAVVIAAIIAGAFAVFTSLVTSVISLRAKWLEIKQKNIELRIGRSERDLLLLLEHRDKIIEFMHDPRLSHKQNGKSKIHADLIASALAECAVKAERISSRVLNEIGFMLDPSQRESIKLDLSRAQNAMNRANFKDYIDASKLNDEKDKCADPLDVMMNSARRVHKLLEIEVERTHCNIRTLLHGKA